MKHITLVEDDPAIRDSLFAFFAMTGIARLTYLNNDNILDGSYEYPDLFLIDKQLSGVDGIELCKYLKSQEGTRHIPVIMMSASPHIIQLAHSAGADDAIVKPYELTDLKDMLLKYL